jgi:predicted RNA binding protein YcfA (HicA-like mRNA interferase family)
MHSKYLVLGLAFVWALLMSASAFAQGKCPDGMVKTVDTKGQCCWPGQSWNQSKKQCVGIPDCPSGFSADGESCTQDGGNFGGNNNNWGGNNGGSLSQSQFVDAVTPDDLERIVKQLGWEVISEPTRLNTNSVTLPIVKGSTGGAASLNDFSGSGGEQAARIFVDSMGKNDGAVTVRSGARVISVLMPGNRAEADSLMRQITGTSLGKGASFGGGGGSVGSMTPSQLEGAMQRLGWQVVGEPTRLNAGSVTLPVVQGAVGGAVSLNDFSDLGGDLATSTFVTEMQKQDGAVTVREGNKVLTVLIPGNKAASQNLMNQLLPKGGGAGGFDQKAEAAVGKMNPAKVEAKVKKLGWEVVGEPTRLNKNSVTLPVVKGFVGGAVALNDFDPPNAADYYVEEMQKNDGAVMVRSGAKVLTVLIPGNRQAAQELIQDLLK